MFHTIEEYLEALKIEMQGSDAALTQDALADAREHLYMALASAREEPTFSGEAEALQPIIEEYGTPEETAMAYREIEQRTAYPLRKAKDQAPSKSFWSRVFSVYIDPHTWGAILFMFITFITGLIYFTWAVSGLALSLSLMILIIGVPFAILFLFSVQGLALLEGRLVEGLLGVRMPRRPSFAQPGLKWLERLKALVTDKHTWLSMLYMVLQMPLGVIYFSLNIVLFCTALAAMATPFLQIFFHNPVITLETGRVFLPFWALILIGLGGFALLTLTMHLARAVGGLHGRYAKLMLVR